MIVCSEHQVQLQQRVCARAMGHLLHRPYGDFEDLTAELCGRRPREIQFDPLREAYRIAERLAVCYGGRYLTAPRANGTERCPVCELVDHFPAEFPEPHTFWIVTVVSHVERRARELGLMPRAA